MALSLLMRKRNMKEEWSSGVWSFPLVQSAQLFEDDLELGLVDLRPWDFDVVAAHHVQVGRGAAGRVAEQVDILCITAVGRFYRTILT